jgi:hypothetical protein
MLSFFGNSHALRPLLALASLAAIALLPGTSLAKLAAPAAPAPPGPATKAAPRPATTAVTKLAEEPLRMPEVGLTVYYPADFLASTTQLSQMVAGQIAPKDRSWVINISTPRTTTETPDPVSKADAILASISRTVINKPLKSGPDKSGVLVFEPESFEITPPGERPTRKATYLITGLETPGDRFYALLPTAFGNKFGIRGVTVHQPRPDQFVVFELSCDDQQLETAKSIYELIIATAVFEDPAKLAASRRDAVAAGQQLLRRFGPEELFAALPAEQQTFRLYRPGATGDAGEDEELGFRTVRFSRAKRSAMNPNQAPRGEDPEGILLNIQARLFSKLAPGSERYQLVDTIATYFMTPDRSDELWSVRTSIRDSGQSTPGVPARKPRTLTEVGARTGTSISVSVTETGQPAKAITPTIGGDGYLSQLEMYLLPRMLVRSQLEIETGFYTYRSESESIALRRDGALRDPAQAGAWTVTTRFREGDNPQTAIYRDNGDLLSAALPDGRIWQAASMDQLITLYKKKNLPISDK